MKLIELVKANKVFESLAQNKNDFSLSYKLMKLIKGIHDDIEFYDNKAREIVEKYALRDEEGKPVSEDGNIHLDPAKQDELNKEVVELNTTEVGVPAIKFSLQELQGLKLSAVELMALENFIEEA